MWDIAAISILWVVWLERNRKIFEEQALDARWVWEIAWLKASRWLSLQTEFQAWKFSDIIRGWFILS